MTDSSTGPAAETGQVEGADRRMLVDLGVVLGLFAVAGVLAGVLWPRLVEPVTVVRLEVGTASDEVALAHQISQDGWYAVLAGVGGLVLGVACMAWRRTHEVVTLLGVLAGAGLAALLAARVGGFLGPSDPSDVLADATVGTTASAVLAVHAEGVFLVWPIAAVAGALVVLWSGPGERLLGRGRRDPDPAEGDPDDVGGPEVSPIEPHTPPSRS